MAITHAVPGQLIDIAPLGAALPNAISHAILKTRSLEVIRLVMRAGDAMPAHHVSGEITLQCIEGSVEITADGSVFQMRAHQLVMLAGQSQHALRALQDSSLLLTIQLPAGMPGSESSTG